MLLVGLMLYAMYALFTGIMEHQIYLFCRTKLDYSLNGGEAITSSVKNVHEQIYSDSRVFRLSNYDSVEASELLSGLKQMTVKLCMSPAGMPPTLSTSYRISTMCLLGS